jgi:four helix bundle protein
MVADKVDRTTLKTMKPYEKLRAWQQCHELVLAVYQYSRTWPHEERYGLISQARRAAYSAAANIVEGCVKQGPREFRRFLDNSLGSLYELAYLFHLVKDLRFGKAKELERLEAIRESASKLTWRLYEAIKKKGLR